VNKIKLRLNYCPAGLGEMRRTGLKPMLWGGKQQHYGPQIMQMNVAQSAKTANLENPFRSTTVKLIKTPRFRNISSSFTH